VGRRFDVLSCLHEALITEFKENGTFCVQCTGGDVQSSRQLPTFVLVSQAKLCKGEKVPCSYSMNSVRAKAWEGLRQRCLDEHCPLRDSGKPLELDVALDEQEQGGDCIDIQEDDEEPDAGTTPSKGTQPQDPDSVPDALKKDRSTPSLVLWSKALGLKCLKRSSGILRGTLNINTVCSPNYFCFTCCRGKRLLTGICHAATASRVIILTRTAHPGLLVAGRMLRLRVHAFFDSTKIHSQKNGERAFPADVSNMRYRPLL